jgi:hypothetical protein
MSKATNTPSDWKLLPPPMQHELHASDSILRYTSIVCLVITRSQQCLCPTNRLFPWDFRINILCEFLFPAIPDTWPGYLLSFDLISQIYRIAADLPSNRMHIFVLFLIISRRTPRWYSWCRSMLKPHYSPFQIMYSFHRRHGHITPTV